MSFAAFVARHPFQLAAASLLVEVAAAVAAHGTGVEAFQAAARYSGRLGLAWFALPFAASSLAVLRPGPAARALLARRRALGLAFGVHHFVHLGLLLAYLSAAGRPLDPARAAGGAAGYAVLALMMATSNDTAVRRLGPRAWSRLHRVGAWFLWLVFFLTYLPRVQGKLPEAGGSMPWFVACLALVVALGALRFAAAARGRTPAPSGA